MTLCAGLPLAISVAGALRARDPDRSTTELADRIAARPLDVLVYADRDVARTIGAGVDQLDPVAQRLFLGLGLLQLPEFGTWTAAAVLDGDSDAFEMLLRLAGSQLLLPAGPRRYRFHDLTRDYARQRAVDSIDADDQRALTDRVYGTLLTLARQAHRAIYGGDLEVVHSGAPDRPVAPLVRVAVERDPVGWFDTERTNLRAAVRHAAELRLTGICWDLAISAHEYYNLHGYLDDWHATHHTALEACREAGDSRGEAAILASLGQPSLVSSRLLDLPGPDELRRAVELFETAGDPHGTAIALCTLANAWRRAGRFDAAITAFERALALYTDSGDPVGRWQSLRYIGQVHLDLGDHDRALRMLLEAADVAADVGHPRLRAQTAYWLGRAHLMRGDPESAREQFGHVLDAAETAHDRNGSAYAHHGLGDVARLADHPDEARHHLGAALDLAREIDDAVLEGRVYQSLADLHRARGEVAEERAALANAAACFGSSSATYLRAGALTALAETTG